MNLKAPSPGPDHLGSGGTGVTSPTNLTDLMTGGTRPRCGTTGFPCPSPALPLNLLAGDTRQHLKATNLLPRLWTLRIEHRGT